MTSRQFRQSSPKLAIGSVLLLLITALAACGTLDISLNQTLEPTQAVTGPEAANFQDNGMVNPATPNETPEPAAGWGPLIPYSHPLFGYELLVPESAIFIEDDLDESITVFSDRGPAESPSYSIGVKVSPASGQSPEELLSELSAGESDRLEIEPVEMNGGNGSGALVSYNVGAGTFCTEMWPLMAAFVVRDIGYAIHIFSDGPGLCDAVDVPEALTIVESFRPPANTPVLAMTPTPTPASIEDLVVVFTKENNAWLWTEASGERQLTIDGGVDQVLLSDDKRVIAFRRGDGIWAVNADGSDERQLVKGSDLPVPQEGELAGSITGITANQLAWIPGTHQLLFNTRLVFDGPGLLLSDDLWSIDADTLSLDYLFAPGEGGNFAIAPDGKQVALITPESISLTTVTGEDKERLFSYTPVLTYSEFRYYAQPVWSPSSDILGVIIPPPDRLGVENQAFGIWRLYTDGTPAMLAGTIETRGNGPLPEPSISPNLETIAYLSSPEVDPERTDLLFVTMSDALGEPIFYTSRVDSFHDWSPGGERFTYTRPDGETAAFNLFIGQLNEEPRPVGNSESVAINVHWLDDHNYLYLQASDRGWDLILINSNGAVTLIASVGGPPPAFDATR